MLIKGNQVIILEVLYNFDWAYLNDYLNKFVQKIYDIFTE